jgi:sulfate transport system substrate-binding protein
MRRLRRSAKEPNEILVGGDERPTRTWQAWINAGAIAAVLLGFSAIAVRNAPGETGDGLVNVSHDPTRELYKALNPLFVASYEKETGRRLSVLQSHGGSSRQARKVISGEEPADVVTLGQFTDQTALRQRGLIADNWIDRLPNHSLPYTSTVVFVVRHGNPHHIRDWPDLLAPQIEIVTPDPRTSSNGKMAAFAAWASVKTRGGSDEEAHEFLRALYRHAPTLQESARLAATTFAVLETGDVHITWENEARREVSESKGKLDIVYPLVSILAEPYVAWVDANVRRRGTEEPAKAYLDFLFSDAAQETIARFGYRPYNPESARKVGAEFAKLDLVPITAIARDWKDANERFYGENGIISAILGARTN